MRDETMNGRPDERVDRDPLFEDAFAALEPVATNPRYWEGFHKSVMSAARFELARRRRLTDLTIAQTVNSWARTVVPSALVAAAAAAAILLVVPPPPPVVDVSIEELLSAGLEGDPIPTELNDDSGPGSMFVSMEIF